MELGVQLKLVCSRLEELLPDLTDYLSRIQSSLELAASPWSLFTESFIPIVRTAETAHNARVESQAAQVGFNSWTLFNFSNADQSLQGEIQVR